MTCAPFRPVRFAIPVHQLHHFAIYFLSMVANIPPFRRHE
jgi:hypothetical protein